LRIVHRLYDPVRFLFYGRALNRMPEKDISVRLRSRYVPFLIFT
jgi:hypothetical protein